jgi:hypothetical protein
MKTRDGSVPDLVRGSRAERPATEDIETSDADPAGDGRPRRPLNTLKTAEIDVARDRRSTMMSPIPAMLAESMGAADKGAAAADPNRTRQPRDPAAPVGEHVERTRRLGDSDRQRLAPGRSAASGLSGFDAGIAPHRQRAARLIDEARAALDAGDLAEAVAAIEEALCKADEAPPPGIVEVIEPARALVTRVFATYVGPLSGIPVRAPRADEIARARLGERDRAVLRRIDGNQTFEELFDGSGLGSTDSLRIAARLLRSGAIRIV